MEATVGSAAAADGQALRCPLAGVNASLAANIYTGVYLLKASKIDGENRVLSTYSPFFQIFERFQGHPQRLLLCLGFFEICLTSASTGSYTAGTYRGALFAISPGIAWQQTNRRVPTDNGARYGTTTRNSG